MRQGIAKIFIILCVVVVGSLTVIYFLNWNKYNSLPTEEKWLRANNQIVKGTYSWPDIGLILKLPNNFSATNPQRAPGSTDPNSPHYIEITRKPFDGSNPSSSATHSDFMEIQISKNQGNLDKFIEAFPGNRDRFNFKLLETSQTNGFQAKWFILTAKHPTDTGKYYWVYFVGKKWGYILQADYIWTKDEIQQIMNGITLQ